jgi:hypothetical protein
MNTNIHECVKGMKNEWGCQDQERNSCSFVFIRGSVS